MFHLLVEIICLVFRPFILYEFSDEPTKAMNISTDIRVFGNRKKFKHFRLENNKKELQTFCTYMTKSDSIITRAGSSLPSISLPFPSIEK